MKDSKIPEGNIIFIQSLKYFLDKKYNIMDNSEFFFYNFNENISYYTDGTNVIPKKIENNILPDSENKPVCISGKEYVYLDEFSFGSYYLFVDHSKYKGESITKKHNFQK